MDKMIRTLGALTIAVALLTSFTACSNEDLLDNNAEQAQTQHILVTAGANIDNNAATRSAVVKDGSTRALTFTAGDRLYISTAISYSPHTVLAGYMTIAGTPASGATNATFSASYASDGTGDLKVYECQDDGTYVVVNHTFASEDVFSECTDIVRAMLVHKDAKNFVINGYNFNYASTIAPTVDELMTQCLPVSGDFYGGNFQLSAGEGRGICPILNCTVTGLEANATYAVVPGVEFSEWEYDPVGVVKTDADGKAVFACTICGDEMEEKNYAIRFCNLNAPYTWKRVSLGSKLLSSKVYNVTRVADDDVASGFTFPTITGASFSSVDRYFNYIINGNAGALNFTLSETSKNVGITMRNYSAASVTLSGLNVTIDTNSSYLNFEENGKDVTLTIDGDNTITLNNTQDCVWVAGNLKLSGNGTLTVHSQNNCFCGMYAYNYSYDNNSNSTTDVLDLSSQLAAPGHTVTRSARTGDSYSGYTWVYKVTD